MQVKLQAGDGHEAAEDGGCELVDVADVLGRQAPHHAAPGEELNITTPADNDIGRRTKVLLKMVSPTFKTSSFVSVLNCRFGQKESLTY